MPDQKKTKATRRKPSSPDRKAPAKASTTRVAAKPAPAAAKGAPKTKTKAKTKARIAPKPSAAKPSAAKAPKAARGASRPTGPDPEGFFVARVRGEDAVRDAPHPMLESGSFDEDPRPPSSYDEGLGDLPWSYGDDALVALPRDPRTLFLFWDHSPATLARAFDGLDQPRAQIWLFVRGAGWERVRVVDFALESRGYYLHDLEPGRTYRVEIHLVDRHGRERIMPHASNASQLPPLGASPVVDDRFVTIPWALPLPRLLGAGVPGGPFSEELRDLLARLSDWARLIQSRGEGAGGLGVRPTSHGGEGR